MELLISISIQLAVLAAAGMMTGLTVRFIKQKKYSFGTMSDLLIGLAGGLTGGFLLYIIEIKYHGYVLPAVSAVITTAILFYVVNVIKR